MNLLDRLAGFVAPPDNDGEIGENRKPFHHPLGVVDLWLFIRQTARVPLCRCSGWRLESGADIRQTVPGPYGH